MRKQYIVIAGSLALAIIAFIAGYFISSLNNQNQKISEETYIGTLPSFECEDNECSELGLNNDVEFFECTSKRDCERKMRNFNKKVKENLKSKYSIDSNIEENLINTWLEPIPGNETELQGFTLFEDGTAESVNMATLVYENWELKNNLELILTSKSIGNGQTLNEKTVYTIESLNEQELKLKSENGYISTFTKE